MARARPCRPESATTTSQPATLSRLSAATSRMSSSSSMIRTRYATCICSRYFQTARPRALVIHSRNPYGLYRRIRLRRVGGLEEPGRNRVFIKGGGSNLHGFRLIWQINTERGAAQRIALSPDAARVLQDDG